MAAFDFPQLPVAQPENISFFAVRASTEGLGKEPLKVLTVTCGESIRQLPLPPHIFRRLAVKLTNLKITPKLGILVGVTLLGLCVAGILAGYLMQREMMNARIEQTKAIVEMGLNLAAALKKEVDAGNMTNEAALAEFGKRANSMTYDKGNGYLFGTTFEGITV